MTSTDPAELTARLAPTHLDPGTTERLRSSVENDAKEPTAAELAKEKKVTDGRAEREWTFPFRWVDGQKKVWEGSFTNKILNIRELQLVGIMRARMGGNVPAEALDPLTAEINFLLAHLAFSLVDTPKWAKELRDLADVQLLQAIYEKVASHEATFFGRKSIS